MNLSSLVYDLPGIPVQQPVQKKVEPKEGIHITYEKISEFNHDYYRNGLNASFGPAGIVTLIGSASGLLMWLSEKTTATLTNFLFSFTENLTVHISRSKWLGDGEIGKERREGAVAWLQLLTAAGGYGGFILEHFVQNNKNDSSNDSFLKKLGFTGLSMVNSPLVLFGFAEKFLLSQTSQGIENHECKGMELNARSDLRVVVSWVAMKVYTWFSSVKPVKIAIDLLLPFLALKDAVGHFAKEGISKVFTNERNIKLPKGLSNAIKTIFFVKDDDKKDGALIKGIFNQLFITRWFLGEGGFRDKYMVPFFKLTGCTVPEFHLDDKNGNKSIKVNIPESNESSDLISPNQNKEIVLEIA